MLDIKIIRENPEKIKAALKTRNADYDSFIDEILEIDEKRRKISTETDALKAEQNKASKRIPVMKKNGENTDSVMAEMKEISVWSFFTECSQQGIQAMIGRGDLIRKISFPKYIVTVSTTLTAVINLLINLVVVIIFALINGVTPSWTWLLVLPLILELYLLALGIAFLLGSIYEHCHSCIHR